METKTERKFNCYKCDHRRSLPGSAHSKCTHPSLKGPINNPMVEIMAIFASVGRAPPMNVSTKELNIQADPHGIKKGWFNFPWNFDPTWLLNCDGYELKKE